MKRAALGIRAHSGWGAVVAVSASVEVLERRRIVVTGLDIAGAKQPYHFAQGRALDEAELHISNCAAASERLAVEGLGEIVTALRRREYEVVGCAILLASGRSLPSLSKILAAHPLIHTAEGEFFRQIFWKASERLGIPVTGIRERELDGHVDRWREEIAAAGASIGPPWTVDQKTASLAALMVLSQ
jgi:hypothetical protein